MRVSQGRFIPYTKIKFVVSFVVLVSLAACAGGPGELALRHVASEPVPLNYMDYKNIPFSQYLNRSAQSIAIHNGLNRTAEELSLISPFEMTSKSFTSCEATKRTGVLLIHGLTDTPYLMRDLASSLIKRNDCLMVRAIALPGHATIPGDLLQVKYSDWIDAANYGVKSFSDSGINNIFIAGFSTGGSLALNYAMQSATNNHSTIHLRGLLLFSPAVRIKSKYGFLTNWHYLLSWLSPSRAWFDILDDKDFAKYESFPKNAADQIHLLTTEKIDIESNEKISTPLFVVLSQDDDTVDSDVTKRFFSRRANKNSQMLLYKQSVADEVCSFSQSKRVCERRSRYDALNVSSFSHTAIPVSPDNRHYGKEGDYKNCYHYLLDEQPSKYAACQSDDNRQFIWGEKSLAENNSALVVRRVTFNPDFTYMVKLMNDFVAVNRN